jgi:hypothetical protein
MKKRNQLAGLSSEQVRVCSGEIVISARRKLRLIRLIALLATVGFFTIGGRAEAGSLAGFLRAFGHSHHHRHSHARNYSRPEEGMRPPEPQPGNASIDTGATRTIAPSTAPIQQNASATATEGKSQEHNFPHGIPVPNKQGFVTSPFAANKVVDVRGFPSGTEVKDPYTGKVFITP